MCFHRNELLGNCSLLQCKSSIDDAGFFSSFDDCRFDISTRVGSGAGPFQVGSISGRVRFRSGSFQVGSEADNWQVNSGSSRLQVGFISGRVHFRSDSFQVGSISGRFHFRSGNFMSISFNVGLIGFRICIKFETLSLAQILDRRRRCLVGWVGIVHRWFLGHFE
ncbi:hypothetical protein GQ457_13G009040 [Hibiscus cannabinus]